MMKERENGTERDDFNHKCHGKEIAFCYPFFLLSRKVFARADITSAIGRVSSITRIKKNSITIVVYQPNPAHSIDKYETFCFSSSHPQSKWVFFVAVPRRPWATISIGLKAANGDSITVAVK